MASVIPLWGTAVSGWLAAWGVLAWLFSTVDTDLVEIVKSAGAVGVLAFAVIAFMRGWIVPGSVAEQLRDERDKALELVYRQAQLAERALAVGEKASRSAP